MPELILDPVTGHYFPTLYVNEFWLLREHLIEINDTTVELPLEMSYNTYTMMYWQLQLQMEESFRAQQAFGATSHGDLDEFKVRGVPEAAGMWGWEVDACGSPGAAAAAAEQGS